MNGKQNTKGVSTTSVLAYVNEIGLSLTLTATVLYGRKRSLGRKLDASWGKHPAWACMSEHGKGGVVTILKELQEEGLVQVDAGVLTLSPKGATKLMKGTKQKAPRKQVHAYAQEAVDIEALVQEALVKALARMGVGTGGERKEARSTRESKPRVYTPTEADVEAYEAERAVDEGTDLDTMTMRELRHVAKGSGIPYYGKLSIADLREALKHVHTYVHGKAKTSQEGTKRVPKEKGTYASGHCEHGHKLSRKCAPCDEHFAKPTRREGHAHVHMTKKERKALDKVVRSGIGESVTALRMYAEAHEVLKVAHIVKAVKNMYGKDISLLA